MAIISVPAKFGFSSVSRFALQRASNVIRSRYSGARQVISYPYAIWELEATLVEYDSTQASLIRSFLVQLEGQKNTFRLPVPAYTHPSTTFAGNGTANGAAAARVSSIPVTGLTASIPIVSEGDYISINDELKLVTASVASNASGQATIPFKPALRKPIASGQAIIFQNPTILMQATNDDVASWGISPPARQNVKFKAMEAIEL
jgi:hypothetical protein